MVLEGVGRRHWGCWKATLELIAHAVDLLYVGEDHLRVDSLICHHSFHVLGCEKVGNAGESPWGFGGVCCACGFFYDLVVARADLVIF